ncbi:MAG: methylenetetrahydrofolate reductase C-terminal domain-containing protein [Planctomycetota bacterium]|nr:methylenetetrahydrofolate reductase C-terminal domain-containing protein [Planctomycetota bacterium]
MNATERKPNEEILESVEGLKKVFILGCQGCPIGCDTGGQPWVDEITELLGKAGKEITGSALIDMICNKAIVGIKLGRIVDKLAASEAILVGSCGVGVQAVGNMVGRLAVPAMNTICMGDYQGLWPSEERCAECGECMLAYTGGLCPITLCAKGLVNGICGGTGDDGSCEVSSDRRCGWLMIYERLEALGRLDDYKHFHLPKDFRKRDISDANRKTIRWAMELAEEEIEPEPAEK